MGSNIIEFSSWLRFWIPLQTSLKALFRNSGSCDSLDTFRCILKWKDRAKTESTNNWYRRIILISIIKMIEAKIAYKRAIFAIEEKHQANPQKKQRDLFR